VSKKTNLRSTQRVKVEFRGLVKLNNLKNGSKFRGFLTDKETEDLLKFIQSLKTNDYVEFVVSAKN